MTAVTAGLQLDPLDPDDEAGVADWLALLDATVGDVPDQPPPCPTDQVGSLHHAPPDTALEGWVARLDGRLVGALRLALPAGAAAARIDQLLVHPDLRRRRVGRALYEHALRRATAHGRETITGTVVEALPGGPPRDPAPAVFAAASGANRAGAGVRQRLDLDRDDPPAAIPPVGYVLARWGTVTPDCLVHAVSALETMLGDGPLDGPLDATYARRFETMRLGRGRRAHHTGVVHEASGRLIGYTSLSMTVSNPEHALQGMTVVHAEHRGHGLGLVLKRANLAHARHLESALRVVDTTNDEDNYPMIAVNRAMGFTPRDRWVVWNRPLPPR